MKQVMDSLDADITIQKLGLGGHEKKDIIVIARGLREEMLYLSASAFAAEYVLEFNNLEPNEIVDGKGLAIQTEIEKYRAQATAHLLRQLEAEDAASKVKNHHEVWESVYHATSNFDSEVTDTASDGHHYAEMSRKYNNIIQIAEQSLPQTD